jgi:Skp family chaperone for outer membrane proteins
MNLKAFVRGLFSLPIIALVAAPMVASAEISEADFAKAYESYLSKDDNIEKMAKAFERFAMKKQKEDAAKQAESQAREIQTQRLPYSSFPTTSALIANGEWKLWKLYLRRIPTT